MVDPANATLEVFVLRDGVYVRYGVYTEGSTFASPVLGKDVTLSGIFVNRPEA